MSYSNRVKLLIRSLPTTTDRVETCSARKTADIGEKTQVTFQHNNLSPEITKRVQRQLCRIEIGASVAVLYFSDLDTSGYNLFASIGNVPKDQQFKTLEDVKNILFSYYYI